MKLVLTLYCNKWEKECVIQYWTNPQATNVIYRAYSICCSRFMLSRRILYDLRASVPNIHAQLSLLFVSWWPLAMEGNDYAIVLSRLSPINCAANYSIEKDDQHTILTEKSNKYFVLTDNFFRDFMIRTIAASISCFRSSSTLLLVSLRSGSDSPLAATVWILTLQYEYISKNVTNKFVNQ